jgi:hypothetical protein
MSKTCRECFIEKPLAEFNRNQTRADGFAGECKLCAAAYQKAYRQTENGRKKRLQAGQRYNASDAVRKNNQRYAASEKGRKNNQRYAASEKGRQTRLRYNKANPEKNRARNAVNNAIRDGILIRQPCIRCGNSKTHGHHEDYTKPLDVIWFCRFHHKERHKELRDSARALT